MWLPLPWALFWTLLSSLSLKALSLVPLSVSQLSLSALSKPPLSCLLALSQLSLELSFSFFTKENIALFLTFYKGKHSPILDFLQRKTWPYSWFFTKENIHNWVITKKGGTQKGGTHVANYNIQDSKHPPDASLLGWLCSHTHKENNWTISIIFILSELLSPLNHNQNID